MDLIVKQRQNEESTTNGGGWEWGREEYVRCTKMKSVARERGYLDIGDEEINQIKLCPAESAKKANSGGGRGG